MHLLAWISDQCRPCQVNLRFICSFQASTLRQFTFTCQLCTCVCASLQNCLLMSHVLVRDLGSKVLLIFFVPWCSLFYLRRSLVVVGLPPCHMGQLGPNVLHRWSGALHAADSSCQGRRGCGEGDAKDWRMVRLHLQFHGGCAQDSLLEACCFIS